MKLLTISIGFHRSRLLCIFLVPRGDYEDVKESAITMNPIVVFRLLILKGFMRFACLVDFVMTPGK